MDELFKKLAFTYKIRYANEKLNQAINYFQLLNEMGFDIIKNDTNIDLETILYSKYYWYIKFMKYHKYQYGEDAALKQKRFNLLEELDQQLQEGINFTIILKIEELCIIDN